MSNVQNSITIHKDFYKDWVEILRDILIRIWKYDADIVNGMTDDDLPIYYFNAYWRRVTPARRTVHCSDVFACPSEYIGGWELFKQTVESGGDLIPYLSKVVQNLTKTDAMLDDWKVHHFHLGTELENGYIKRTGALVFAYVTDTDMYIVNVFKHGDWERDEIIEIIHRNWPDLLEGFKVSRFSEIPYHMSAADRKLFRKYNINSGVVMSDGTVYMAIGGGLTVGGMLGEAVSFPSTWRDRYKGFEASLNKNIDKLLPSLCRHGYDGVSDLHAKLLIDGDDCYAFFPELSCAIPLSNRT